jgi:hypothetical protein
MFLEPIQENDNYKPHSKNYSNYHFLGWVLTWKYLKQGFWGKILVFG